MHPFTPELQYYTLFSISCNILYIIQWYITRWFYEQFQEGRCGSGQWDLYVRQTVSYSETAQWQQQPCLQRCQHHQTSSRWCWGKTTRYCFRVMHHNK